MKQQNQKSASVSLNIYVKRKQKKKRNIFYFFAYLWSFFEDEQNECADNYDCNNDTDDCWYEV
jgi:hypothetical protein